MDLYANAAPLMIRRGHIAEDGYARVMQLSTENLKLNFVYAPGVFFKPPADHLIASVALHLLVPMV